MGDLYVGERLLLSDGHEAVVESLQREYAPAIFENWTPGKASTGTLGTPADPQTGIFTTYNFEVADWHTYFAGKLWVHNTGRLCPEATEAIRKWKDQGFNKQERAALWEQRKLGNDLQAGSFSQVLPNNAIVVRGGIKDLPPPGTVFSGATGTTVESAAQGIPHGQMRATTVGDVRAQGGTVELAPEKTRAGNMNWKHVNISEGGTPTTFGPLQTNPVPPKDRIK